MKKLNKKDFNHLDYPLAYECKGRYRMGLGICTGADVNGFANPSFLFDGKPVMYRPLEHNMQVELLDFNDRDKVLFKGSHYELAMKVYDYFIEGRVSHWCS